ncbi:MAG: hypothetical protein B7Y99_09295 [Caulobacterales bacterium 32-69-10]|nr:MAG: hypothetical protein B7Y99_09295 [Caulobacterales bacterium 32-69-10]
MSGPPKLTIVPDTIYRLDRPPETTGQRARRQQFEAKILAREHIEELRRALEEAEALAATLANGGELYPPGVRDTAGRIHAHLDAQSQTLNALLDRLPEPRP